jgi:hypothetical protein
VCCVDVFLAFWCCEGAWFGLSDSLSRPTTMRKPANEEVDKAMLRLVSSIKIQDQPEVVVALQTAAAIVCGAGQMYDIYHSCTAAVKTIALSILSYPYVSSCSRGSCYCINFWMIL